MYREEDGADGAIVYNPEKYRPPSTPTPTAYTKEELDEIFKSAHREAVQRETIKINGIVFHSNELPSSIVTEPEGGKHSLVVGAFHLLPAQAIEEVSAVLEYGATRYEPVTLHNSLAANWRKIPRYQHVRHALAHLFKFLRGNKEENHLVHAACRLLFAIETE